jgi:hypothetical protein
MIGGEPRKTALFRGEGGWDIPPERVPSRYAAQDFETRSQWADALHRTLVRLLGIQCAEPTVPQGPDHGPRFSDLRDALAGQLEQRLQGPGHPHDPTATRALVDALVDRPERGPALACLVEEVAEILFVPRHERSEYVDHPLDTPPWRIRKLMLEYALLSREIDDLVGFLNKGFCANACDRLPVGCCSILGYDMGLVPETLLKLQDLEARWQATAGWPWRPLVPGEVERKCRYHTDRGCVLARFKSPACIGYLCPPLLEHLGSRFPPADLGRFLQALARFRNQPFDRDQLFGAMQRVLDTGGVLRGHRAGSGFDRAGSVP